MTAASSAKRGKVLVLGDDTRSFLAITRSLGRQGVEVHAGPANFVSFALKSRYITQVHFLPYWMDDGAEWLRAMEALLTAERFDLVIPCDETTLLPIQQNRARLEQLARLAIPNDRSIDVLFDKHNTRELARSLGIPVSPGRLPSPDDSAAGVLAELGSPVVVKPRRSYAPERLHSRGKVRIVQDAAELTLLLPHLDPAEYVYEAFLPGRGVGISLLASGGRVLQAFEHHRVRENVSGSYYRVSAPLTPALEKSCADIIAALEYTGVAMFEFRLGADSWVLLEVNARPWGSMPLPVALGVDFPYLWYQLLVNGVEAPQRTYKTGVYGRNLIPDLWSTVADARHMPGGTGRKLGLGLKRLAELGRVITGREVHDVLVRDDLAPGLRELWGTTREIAARVTRRVPGSARHPARTRSILQQALLAAGAGERRIVFVCQGNICRSPFAEAALRAKLRPEAGLVSVDSYGMLPRPGRPTPDFGIAAAAASGVDLRLHRSTHLTRAAADSATAIFIFDDINHRAIFDRYPGLHTPVLYLGDLAPSPIASIADPIDGAPEMYAAIYDKIGAAVDELAKTLNARSPA